MRKCNGHLSNKNVLSNFLKEFLLREESFNLAGRPFQIVGPETLNNLGPNVIVEPAVHFIRIIIFIIIKYKLFKKTVSKAAGSSQTWN